MGNSRPTRPESAVFRADETGGIILCPVDHPMVSAELVARLIEEFDASGKSIVLPTYRGRRGHPRDFSREPL